jgi:hypothetical protein
MIDELQARRDQLAQTLGVLETHGDDKLITRVEALAKTKVETQQRIARLDECFGILNTIRSAFGELEERQAHLERALSEVETDAAGRSLDDRQTELNEFAAQTRVRVRVLQDSATALNGFRQEIDKSQAALVPLQAPADGIEALIGDLHVRRDRLIKTLNEIELHGDEKLSARVEARQAERHARSITLRLPAEAEPSMRLSADDPPAIGSCASHGRGNRPGRRIKSCGFRCDLDHIRALSRVQSAVLLRDIFREVRCGRSLPYFLGWPFAC